MARSGGRRAGTARWVKRIAGGAAALVLALFVGLQCWYLGWILHYRDHPPRTTAFMALRQGPDGTLAHRWVSYDRISTWLKRAVVAAEDARFARHNGFDWQALREALAANLEANRIVRGGSTISQQLAKNLFLSPRQSLLRKGQEALIVVMLEATLSKRRILEIYLNVIEWGDGIFGAEAAARHYYGRPAAAIGRWQASLLAARIPRPRYYDRRGVTDYLRERAGDIHGWAPMVRLP